MRTLAIRTALFATAFVLVPGTAHPQNADSERVAQLEAQLTLQEAELAKQQAALAKLRAQVEALRSPASSSPAPKPPEWPAYVVRSPNPYCLLGPLDWREISKQYALNDCHVLAKTRDGKTVLQGEAKMASPAIDTPDPGTSLPGRPLSPYGIAPLLSLGSSDKASITWTKSLNSRFIWLDSDMLSPTVTTLKLSASTSLASGIGTFLDLRDRTSPERADLDYLSGTSVSFGIDRAYFRKRGSGQQEERYKDFRKAAIAKCLSDAKNESLCGDRLGEWLFKPKADANTPEGASFAHPELVTQLYGLIWRNDAEERPEWGWGGSIAVSDRDFTFRQGNVNDITGLDNIRKLSLDPATALADPVTRSKTGTLLEGHAFYYWPLDPEKPWRKPVSNVPGIMLVGQLQFKSEAAFRPKTSATICDPPVALAGSTPTTIQSCTLTQFDRPYRQDDITGSLETRIEFENVPVVGKFGIAPRMAYTFDDGGKVFDLPLYFMQEKGLTAGIRGRVSFDSNDILGNPEDDYWQLQLFFTPLTFKGF